MIISTLIFSPPRWSENHPQSYSQLAVKQIHTYLKNSGQKTITDFTITRTKGDIRNKVCNKGQIEHILNKRQNTSELIKMEPTY